MKATFHGGPLDGRHAELRDILALMGLHDVFTEENILPCMGLSLTWSEGQKEGFEYAVCGGEEGGDDQVHFYYRRASYSL